MRYRISHTTVYEYSDQVSQGYSVAYLVPRDTPEQKVLRSELKVSPLPATQLKQFDYFGNTVCSFSVEKPHKKLEVRVDSEVEVAPSENRLLGSGMTCADVRQAIAGCATAADIQASEFCFNSPMIGRSNELADFASALFSDEREFVTAVNELNNRIFEEFQYDPGFTTVATPLDEVLLNKRGVCQDFAHFAIGVLRSLGFAARYVSGYLETLPPPGQQKLKGADASHAWFAVYVPGDDWYDFDPTNGAMPSGQHITTAWGRDYSDVTPLKGVVFGGGADQILSVAVDVERVNEGSARGQIQTQTQIQNPSQG